MSGETNLNALLAGMSAELAGGVYVFVTCAPEEVPAALAVKMRFDEAEGTTLIVLKQDAEAAGLAYEFPSRMITLTVHSALDAVGFLAVITRVLADAGMGVNPVAGFYHDHLFVPEERAEDAMKELAHLSQDVSSGRKSF